jgi:hypothetical protein
MAQVMTARCTLETEGYRVVFHLQNLDASREYFDGSVELSLQPDLGELVIKSPPTFLGVSDLRRLVTYFEEHISRLQGDPDAEAPVFVPLELGFQVQALSGDVGPETEGEFTLRFMLNVGQREGCSRTYVGAEAVTTVQSVRDFTASLDTVLAEVVTVK